MSIVIILILLSGITIYLSKGELQVTYLLISFLLLSSSLVLLNSPQIKCHLFLIILVALSLNKNKQLIIKNIPLKSLWLIYFICFGLIAFNAQEFSGFSVFYKPFRTFITSYFLIFIGYSCHNNFKFNNKIINVLIFVTLYGFFTTLIKNDPIRDLLQIEYNRDYYWGNRLRISSTWSHPISYGFVCASLLISMIGSINIDKKHEIAAILLFLSAILCGSRTVQISLIVMICIYTLVRGTTKQWSIFMISILSIIVSAILIHSVGEALDGLWDNIQGEETLSGSSMSMRDEQLEGSLEIASAFPIYGGGFDYIQEGLGYGNDMDDKYWMLYGNLYGFESYLYTLIIERGILGCIAEILVIFCLFNWIFLRRNIEKDAAAKATAILVGFYTFALMTGTLDSWVFSMFLVGVYMGKLNSNNHTTNHTLKNLLSLFHHAK